MGSFSVWHWMIVAFIVGLPAMVLVNAFKRRESRFCTQCGHVGAGKLRTKGSLLVEIALWICFIVPGLIYSIWRHSCRDLVCASCGTDHLVPPDSPMAREMRAELAAVQK